VCDTKKVIDKPPSSLTWYLNYIFQLR